jgi:hypothetical protein
MYKTYCEVQKQQRGIHTWLKNEKKKDKKKEEAEEEQAVVPPHGESNIGS